MSNRERKDYESFLREGGYTFWNIAMNMGQFSIGCVKWRPYASAGGQLATSPGMINKEILVIEKKKGNQSFRVFTNMKSSIQDLKRRRRAYIYLFLLLAFVSVWRFAPVAFPSVQWTWISYRLELSNMILLPILGIGFLYSIWFIVFLSGHIMKQKKEERIRE